MPDACSLFPLLALALLATAAICAVGWYQASTAYADAIEKITSLRGALRARGIADD